MSEGLLIVLVIVAFPFFFFGMVSLVLVIVGTLGGWRALAVAYPKYELTDALVSEHRMSSVSLGLFGRYNNLISVKVYADRLVLALPISEGYSVRVMHPPIHIPFDRIGETRPEFFGVTRFGLEGSRSGFTLRGSAKESLLGVLGR